MNLQPGNLKKEQENTHIICFVYAMSAEVSRLNVLFINCKFHR